MVIHHLLNHPSGGGSEEVQQVQQDKTGDGKEEEPLHGRLVQAAVDNVGDPIICGWMNKPKSFAMVVDFVLQGGGSPRTGVWA